jgi:hypothetical protein
MLVVPIAFACDITDEPYILLPYSTATSAGVQVVETLVDENSGETVGPIKAPP